MLYDWRSPQKASASAFAILVRRLLRSVHVSFWRLGVLPPFCTCRQALACVGLRNKGLYLHLHRPCARLCWPPQYGPPPPSPPSVCANSASLLPLFAHAGKRSPVSASAFPSVQALHFISTPVCGLVASRRASVNPCEPSLMVAVRVVHIAARRSQVGRTILLPVKIPV